MHTSLLNYLMQDSYEQYTENIDKDMDMQHPSAGEDAQHKMRLSIDIRSIKDANFKGYIYAKYYANPTLGKDERLTSRINFITC